MTIKRYDIINKLIEAKGYEKYLEIGVQYGVCFDNIFCKTKVGVDPKCDYPVTHPMTSDNFFKKNKELFDIIFIDGLHHSWQVMKDIFNALTSIKDGGSIVIHDCNPTDYHSQVVPRKTKVWNGDVWIAWVSWKSLFDEMSIINFVVDEDHGCGVVLIEDRPKIKKMPPIKAIQYISLDLHRKSLLNLITYEKFLTYL